jgi:hypothetical protein
MDSQLAFVTNPLRYVDKDDDSLHAKYASTARIVSLETNLDEAGALRRLDEELVALGTTRVFEITVQKLYMPDDFAVAPPRFAIYSPLDGLDGQTLTAFEISEVNPVTGTSTLKVR